MEAARLRLRIGSRGCGVSRGRSETRSGVRAPCGRAPSESRTPGSGRLSQYASRERQTAGATGNGSRGRPSLARSTTSPPASSAAASAFRSSTSLPNHSELTLRAISDHLSLTALTLRCRLLRPRCHSYTTTPKSRHRVPPACTLGLRGEQPGRIRRVSPCPLGIHWVTEHLAHGRPPYSGRG